MGVDDGLADLENHVSLTPFPTPRVTREVVRLDLQLQAYAQVRAQIRRSDGVDKCRGRLLRRGRDGDTRRTRPDPTAHRGLGDRSGWRPIRCSRTHFGARCLVWAATTRSGVGTAVQSAAIRFPSAIWWSRTP